MTERMVDISAETLNARYALHLEDARKHDEHLYCARAVYIVGHPKDTTVLDLDTLIGIEFGCLRCGSDMTDGPCKETGL